MKIYLFAICLFLLSSILFSAGCAAPTSALTATQTSMPTATQTPAATPTVTETPIPTEAPVEAKDFPQVTPENYRDCVITPDQIEQYRDWYRRTISKPFPANTNNEISMNPNNHIAIDPSMARFDATACTLDTGDGYLRIVMPIEVKDINSSEPENKDNNIIIMAVCSLYINSKTLSPKESDGFARQILDIWRNKRKSQTFIIPGSTLFIAGYPEPFFTEAQSKIPDISAKFEDFENSTDLKGLGERGVVVQAGIYTMNGN